ncbi:MAG: ABC transporter ATP-binding protein [Bacteroidales bacterium]
MKPLLEARNIYKQFATHRALTDVSVSVPEQSIYGLLGPNGAGKTTLIRIINQITAPDTGEILFKDQKFTPSHIEKIGYLPEERGLYKKMKVGEQAIYLARLKGLSKQDAQSRLKFWFNKFDIGAWWNKKVEELSKGMQQKVQFIVTIIHEPELLIFDEPFSGFDPINVNLLKEEILNLKEKGSTIIFSTHNMASVEELCDHITLIDNSKKILEGSVKDIKENNKSNTFSLTYKNNNIDLNEILSHPFKVLQQEMGEYGTATISIDHNANQNELLSELLPHLAILSFNEILPSMNDIFISKVKENE